MKGGKTPMNATKQTLKGFTIIEVVLVLAIAGLIFLMVFIALPALQSGQRDTARKNDVSAMASAVTSYTSNNRGAWPEDGATLYSYAQNISDNTAEDGVVVSEFDGEGDEQVTDGQLIVVTGARCGEPGATGDTASYGVVEGTTRQFVVITRLEANNGSAFCQDS